MLGRYLWWGRRLARSRAAEFVPGVAKALILAPHPDDETLGCAGLIKHKLAAGAQVRVIVVTDGSLSHAAVGASRLSELRHHELAEAMRRLGLPSQALRQLDFADASLTAREAELTEAVTRLLDEFGPDEVYVTGVFEPHPDHSALGRAVRRAVAGRRAVGAWIVAVPTVFEYPIWVYSQLWHGQGVPIGTKLATVARALAVLTGLRRAVAVPMGEFGVTKAHALQAHSSQLARPSDLAPEQEWWVLPPELLAAAADEVELFFPWRPR